MKLNKEVLGEMRVKPGGPAGLDGRSTKHVAADWLGPENKDGHDKHHKKVDVYKRQLVGRPDAIALSSAVGLHLSRDRRGRTIEDPSCLLYTSRCV